MGRTIVTPLQLALVGRGSRVTRFLCEELLRVYPKRRFVMRGRWKGRPAVAKLYFGRRAYRDCQRAERGAGLLREASIPAPELLATVHGADRRSALLIFEYIKGETATTAADENQDALYRAGREAMRALHRAGLVHRDPHFGNFLISGEGVWILDPDDITRESSAQTQRRNLALFLAQLPPSAQQAALSEEESGAKLALEVEQAWQRRLKNYRKKSARDCTEFKVWQEGKRYLCCCRTALAKQPELAGLMADPDTSMAGGTMLKDGSSATVVRIPLGEADLVIKRYNIKGAMHFLRRCLGASRARRAWCNANMLRQGGIHTPAPLALVERRHLCGLLPGCAWLVSRFQEGQTLAEYTAENVSPPEQADREIARTFLLLKKMNLVHGDMKASNWIISGDKAYLTDLDSLRQRHRAGVRRGQQRDLQRFLNNWPASSAGRRHYGKLLEVSP